MEGDNNELREAMLNGTVTVGEPEPIEPQNEPVITDTPPVNEPANETPKSEEPKVAPVSPSFDYSEFGVESKEQLQERLKREEEYSTRVKELETELAKPKEYQWQSPAQKAFAESLKGYDGDLGEALITHMRITSLDVDNMNGKDALKENFILSKLTNPKMTREKAEVLFKAEFGDLYKKAEGDSLDEIEPDEVAKIILEEKEYEAKLALKQKQNSIKEAAEKAQQQIEPAQPEIAPEIINSMQREVSALPEVLKDMEKFTFKVDEDPANDFTAALEKGELEVIESELAQILKNPAYYDASGKLKEEFSAKNAGMKLAYALAGDRMVKAALAHGQAQAEINAMKKIEASGKDRGNGYQGGGHAPANEYEAMKQNGVARG